MTASTLIDGGLRSDAGFGSSGTAGRPRPVPLIHAGTPDESVAGGRARERELVIRVQRGDAEAFDGLVAGHLRRARVIAFRLMQNHDDADDLVQDAFLRALERIDGFDPDQPFGPWLTPESIRSGVFG
jgi:hypothetical protein